MERNGLDDRSRERRIGMWVYGVSLFFLISFFLVPYMLPESSVPPLSGRANVIDYSTTASWGNQPHTGEMGHDQPSEGLFAWTELDAFSAFIYAFGDLNCHQKNERSWQINGNQMPVCARDIGIMLGFTVGCALFGFRGLNRWTVRDTFLSVLPDERLTTLYARDSRLIAVIAIMCIGLVPMAVDGFTQLLMKSYESTNLVRLVTGFAAGLVAGWWFSSAFAARPKFFEGASEVILPADAKLVIK